MTHFFVTHRDARSPNTIDDSLDESHLEWTMITKKDLEKDGWRISDEGFDYLIGQFDDEPTYQVDFFSPEILIKLNSAKFQYFKFKPKLSEDF